MEPHSQSNDCFGAAETKGEQTLASLLVAVVVAVGGGGGGDGGCGMVAAS